MAVTKKRGEGAPVFLSPESSLVVAHSKVFMPTPSLHEEPASPDGQARRLNDDVLQSAEDAVLTNPASSADALAPGAFDPGAAADDALPRYSRYQQYQEELAAYVARKPAQSALMAFAAGAVAAALFRAVFSRRGQ